MPEAPLDDPAALNALFSDESYAHNVDYVGVLCDTHQFLRELVYNAFDAGARLCAVTTVTRRVSGHEVTKLAVLDTGCGVSGPVRDNHLFPIGRTTKSARRFGAGVKATALRNNPGGLEYISVPAGSTQAWRLVVSYDATTKTYDATTKTYDATTKTYRLRELEDGKQIQLLDLDDPLVPKEIREAGQGTLVVLWGETPDEDYVQRSVAEGRRGKELTQVLNNKFFTMRPGCKLVCRAEVIKASGTVRTQSGHAVHGTKYWLDRDTTAASRGTVKLGDATAHWWLRDGEPSHDDQVRTGGMFGLLSVDEVYGLQDKDSGGPSMLKRCGVWYTPVAKRMTVFFEPDPELYRPDPSRTVLVCDKNTGLKPSEIAKAVDRWCDEFSELLPDAVTDAIDAVQAPTTKAASRAQLLATLSGYSIFGRLARYAQGLGGSVGRTNLRGHRPGTPTGSQPAKAGGTSGNGGGTPNNSGGTPAPAGGAPKGQTMVQGTSPGGSTPLRELADNVLEIGDIPEILWVGHDMGDFGDHDVDFDEKANTLFVNQESELWVSYIDRLVEEAAPRLGRSPGRRRQYRARVDQLARDKVNINLSTRVIAARMRWQKRAQLDAAKATQLGVTAEDVASYLENYRILVHPAVLSMELIGGQDVSGHAKRTANREILGSAS